MVPKACLAILLVVVGCASGSAPPQVVVDPTIAYPFDAADLSGPDVRDCISRVVALGGYGRMPHERAAFLVLGADGSFRCHVWPFTNHHHGTEWEGAIPEGTCAILHSHPNHLPEPSSVDRMQAKRIGVPLFVLTSVSIKMVPPNDEAIVSFPPLAPRTAERR